MDLKTRTQTIGIVNLKLVKMGLQCVKREALTEMWSWACQQICPPKKSKESGELVVQIVR